MGAQDPTEAFRLTGRVAVVTGAASGIGRETARVLSAAGAKLVVSDVNAAGLAETAALIRETGGNVLAASTDVACKSEVDALATSAVQEFGGVDIWVNAAGVLLYKDMLDIDENDLQRVVSINQFGVYWGSVAAARAMKESGGGSVINISSSGGDATQPGLSLYSMTKAAVNMITRSTAKEFGAFGVRANTIAPGWIDTPMASYRFRTPDGALDPERRQAVMDQLVKVSPLGLTGEPRDIALAALYLAGDASRFVTGQILRPNGGVSMP